jgi:hypothetical protein
MHRSTRMRRLIVALLVVLALAVAVRFARAAGSEGTRDRAPSTPRPAVTEFGASNTFHHTMGLPDE